jgi:D-3-phosphoglycerate dehydrogenase
MKIGEWKKKDLKGFRVQGKTLGVIGYGRIGKKVAKLASSLQMKVVFYDPYLKKTEDALSLKRLLEISDFVTLHLPLTVKSKGMIGKEEIGIMKNGAYLINTARGGIVDEAALLEALNKGKLGGVAIDVYKQQPPFSDEISNALIKNEKVIASPHSIGQTKEAVLEKGNGVIKIIKEHINSRVCL